MIAFFTLPLPAVYVVSLHVITCQKEKIVLLDSYLHLRALGKKISAHLGLHTILLDYRSVGMRTMNLVG